MLPRSCAKSLIVEIAGNFYRENRLLGKIFVPGFVILYSTHNYQLLEPRCSETAFANQQLASVDFWDYKIIFLISSLFEVRIVTFNLHCYLMVVFCLVSPDFGTSSLAFHEHLVSVVVTGLVTFASLAVNSLAPKLFCSHKTRQNAFVFFRSVTSHCFSSLEIWLCRNLLLELTQFLHNHYNGFFTICRLSTTFCRPKFFWRVITAKTSIFIF